MPRVQFLKSIAKQTEELAERQDNLADTFRQHSDCSSMSTRDALLAERMFSPAFKDAGIKRGRFAVAVKRESPNACAIERNVLDQIRGASRSQIRQYETHLKKIIEE